MVVREPERVEVSRSKRVTGSNFIQMVSQVERRSQVTCLRPHHVVNLYGKRQN